MNVGYQGYIKGAKTVQVKERLNLVIGQGKRKYQIISGGKTFVETGWNSSWSEGKKPQVKGITATYKCIEV